VNRPEVSLRRVPDCAEGLRSDVLDDASGERLQTRAAGTHENDCRGFSMSLAKEVGSKGVIVAA